MPFVFTLYWTLIVKLQTRRITTNLIRLFEFKPMSINFSFIDHVSKFKDTKTVYQFKQRWSSPWWCKIYYIFSPYYATFWHFLWRIQCNSSQLLDPIFRVSIHLSLLKVIYFCRITGVISGAIAQLARAPPLQGGGPGFESPLLHQILRAISSAG